ncbi:MAG: TonB-dependent receptor [Pseudomonadota bacterium]
MLHLRITAVVLALLCSLPATAEQAEKRQRFDIQAGPLSDALVALAQQSEHSLFFETDGLATLMTSGLRGRVTVSEALARLLTGHCFEFEFIRPRLVTITPGCAPAPREQETTAQTFPRAAPPQNHIEEIIVRERHPTGARARRAGYELMLPLDVIDATEIRLSGYQSVAELLRYVPAVSGNSTSTLISNGGDGTATLTLRGLPASNTLVLLNGRRINSDALLGRSVDLNTLPLGMVEQIEILKDGVSAIYGSDAVAGVVNILTRKDIEGLELAGSFGGAERGDLETQNLSAMYGHQGDGWQFNAGLSYYNQGGLYSRDRRLSASSDDRVRGGIDKRSSATVPARVTVDGTAHILRDGLAGLTAADYREATSEDRFEYRDFTSSIVPSRRFGLFIDTTVQLNPDLELFADVFATETNATTQLAQVPVFTAFEASNLSIDAAQAFNPFGVEVYDLRRRITELPPRKRRNTTQNLRAIAGLRMVSDNANFTASLQSSSTWAVEDSLNGINASRLQLALQPECVAPCVPINLFGPQGSIDAQMLDYVGIQVRIKGRNQMHALTFDADWSPVRLEAGRVEMAAGLEMRHEALNFSLGDLLDNGPLIAGGNRSGGDGDRTILEGYAESFVPLWRSMDDKRHFGVQLAGRLSWYDDFGYEFNPRLAAHWRILPRLTLRGSIARGFRAPSLLQLFADGQQSFEQLNDPCSNADLVSVFVGCSQASDPSLTQFQVITGGNKDLEAERSLTHTFGLLWQLQAPRTLVEVSTDLFAIRQRDVVESSAQFIVNRNAQLGAFPERVTRNVDGNLSTINASLQNIGQRNVTGVDFTASMSHTLRDQQQLIIAMNTTYIGEFKDKFDPDTPTVDKAGSFSDEASGGLGSLPHWKWNLSLSWQAQFWQWHYNVYHVSEVDELIPILRTRRTIDSWTNHNTHISYFGPLTRWLRVSAGVKNIFDEAPPFSAAAFNDSYDGRTYDITGRYLYLSLEKKLD